MGKKSHSKNNQPRYIIITTYEKKEPKVNVPYQEIDIKEPNPWTIPEKIENTLDSFKRNPGNPSSQKGQKKSFNNKKKAQSEADYSQPAVHLKQDKHPVENKECRKDLDKENCQSGWGNPNPIVKKVKTESHPRIQVNECKNLPSCSQKGPKKLAVCPENIVKSKAPEETNEKNVRGSQRKGLKNLGNTCFSNALFQCLFDVEKFRDSILKELKEKDPTSLLGKLFTLFENLQKRSDETQKAYKDFLETLFDRRKEFKIGDQGDSSILLRALYEELAIEEGTEEVPYLRIFQGGDFIKSKECPDCKDKKIITESLKILDVRDINFNVERQKDFFQSEKELRACVKCKEKKSFICEYTVTRLPEILVIKIHDTIDFDETVKILPQIALEVAQGEEEERVRSVKYGFISGVMNELRGEKGYHSMDLNYKKGSYFLVDDDREVKEVNLEEVASHPKLLFYRKLEKYDC